MSKILGIVAEYNPFHNGHLYHLEKAKKETGSNYVIAVIGGNFTQRGSTSLIDKWSKAEIALLNGVDLVIELPVIYSTSSAENFADGAVKILNSLKVVDYIAFGAESSDIESLDKFADILYNEPKEYKNLLIKELKKGLSFPKARENTLTKYTNSNSKSSKILASPNNILGIEYLKALKKYESKIVPFLVQRQDAGYNDLHYSNNIASATAIRNMIKNGEINILQKLIPASSYSVLMKNIKVRTCCS